MYKVIIKKKWKSADMKASHYQATVYQEKDYETANANYELEIMFAEKSTKRELIAIIQLESEKEILKFRTINYDKS